METSLRLRSDGAPSVLRKHETRDLLLRIRYDGLTLRSGLEQQLHPSTSKALTSNPQELPTRIRAAGLVR